MGRGHGRLLLIILCLFVVAGGVHAADSAMNFKNADIRDVLNALGELADVNVVADPQVQGTVTVFLRGTDPLDALDLVVRTNGYSSLWVGDTLVIGMQDVLSSRFEPTRTRFFPLQYVEAEAIAAALRLVVQNATVQPDSTHRGVLVRGTEDELELAAAFLAARDSERELSLDFRDTDLLTVFHELALRGGYSLLLETPLHGTLTILLQRIDVDEAIALAARQSGVDYRFEGNSLIVGMDAPAEAAAEPTEMPAPTPDETAEGADGDTKDVATADEGTSTDEVTDRPTEEVAEPRHLASFTVHHIDAEGARRLLASAGAVAGEAITVEGKTLFVQGTAAELDAVETMLDKFDLPQVRVDGIVMRADEKLAVLSVDARSYVVREADRIDGLIVVSIFDKEVVLRTARGHKMHVPIGGSE